MDTKLKVMLRVLGALLAPTLVSAALLAQSGEVSLRGQVFDQTGGAIAALTVSATGPDNVVHTAQTNEEGKYVFRNLSPGSYRVEIRLQGFADFVQEGVAVAPGKPQVVDAHLALAVEKQQVKVESEATQVSVSSENNASAMIIKGKDLEALSDDPDELQSDLQALAGPSAGPNGGQIYIDGFTGGQLPPKAAIREIRVNQNPFSAQYDRLGYGRVEIFTKPGMDQFHGQVFASGNASAFNSRNPFASQVPPYHSVFVEGNIGGPLSKRASFFFDGERRNIQDASVVSAITLDQQFNETPFSDSILTPRTRTELSPRFDYQVNKNNTLTMRYQYWKNDVTNGGVGQFSLPSLAFNDASGEHDFQVSDTQILGEGTVNELRFRFERETDNQVPQSVLPTISVLGAFTGGGNGRGRSANLQDNYELQNYTSMNRGKHFIRFGVRIRDTAESNTATSNFNGMFTFPSINAYRITEQGLAQGLTGAQIRALGGGASQFSIVSGLPLIDVNQYDVGLYAEDDWKLRPNMTLSMGVRFETQNNISDHADIAPRIGFAWGLGGAHPKTVLRAGVGVFYDRFGQSQVLNAERLNGITQQQFVVNEPDFYPLIPPVDNLAGGQTFPTIYRIGSTLQAPYIIQSAIGVERQLSKTATVSVTYLNAHGVHQLLTRNINSPLPGTYNPADPTSGIRPFGSVGNVYEYESDGLFNQNQIIANFNIRSGARLSMFGFYTLNFANSNTGGVNSFPMDQYDIAQDYGRASFDVRHRFFLGGTMALPRGFRLSPFLVASSGAPFNISLGRDLNGDSIFNDRPSFATVLTDPNMVITPYGAFNKVPLPGETIVPVNYGQGPGQFLLNMRLAKTFGFGEKKAQGGAGGFGGMHGGGPRGGGLGGRGLSGGGGPGFFGGQPSNARYNLEFSVNARNVLNKVNLGMPVGNLNSPLFGHSNSIMGGFGGSSGANRMLYLQARFSF